MYDGSCAKSCAIGANASGVHRVPKWKDWKKDFENTDHGGAEGEGTRLPRSDADSLGRIRTGKV